MGIGNNLLNNEIRELNLDIIIFDKLIKNDIHTIRDLWNLKRKDLKGIGLNDNEINQTIIKMQLYGIDLNKKIYDKN